MNRKQFFSELDRCLRRLPQNESEEALRYYDEYISDAENESEAIASLGSPGSVAAKIIAVWADAVPEPSHEQSDKKRQNHDTRSTSRNGFKAFWIVLLAVFASRIALPLALSIAVLAVVLVAVVLSIAAAGLGMVIGGAVYIIYSFILIVSSFCIFWYRISRGQHKCPACLTI